MKSPNPILPQDAPERAGRVNIADFCLDAFAKASCGCPRLTRSCFEPVSKE